MARQLNRLSFGRWTHSAYVKIQMIVDLREILRDKREGMEIAGH